MASPYGYIWRKVTRPTVLERSGYKCERCGLEEPKTAYYMAERKEGLVWVKLRSRLEIAHLDGDPSNCAPENLACLCIAHHRAHDYKQWAARCRETRSIRKDGKRPLLQEAPV